MGTANTHTHSLTYTDTRLHIHPPAHPPTHPHKIWGKGGGKGDSTGIHSLSLKKKKGEKKKRHQDIPARVTKDLSL